MNRYLIISRLRWPAILLLTGVIALLDQADILSWGRAWPLYLILFGVLALAERATFAAQPPPPAAAYPYSYAPGYPPEPYPGAYAAGYPASNPASNPAANPAGHPQAPPPSPGTNIVPTQTGLEVRATEFGIDREEREKEGR